MSSFLGRRDFLKRAGLLGGLIFPGAGVGLLTPRSSALGGVMGDAPGDGMIGDLASSLTVVPFQAAFRVPPVLTPARVDAHADYYDITMRAAEVEILPGRRTTIWGFNGEFPGPTIRARRGRRVVVRQRNDLPDAQPSIHLHGGHVEPSSDGHPTDVIARGMAKDYVYPNRQLTSTLSYHDHQMGETGRNIYMGLFGAYLIEDDAEAGLRLPSGAHDVPVIIQDRSFAIDGSLKYYPNLMGTTGEVILVNGVPQPRFDVANRRYRLRILNGSNARAYDLALSSGQSFVQIATDGGLLPHPVRRTNIPVSPFERVEVVVDFSEVPVGTPVILRNQLENGRLGQIMLFDVVRHEADASDVPPDLRPLDRLAEGSASVTREFTEGTDKLSWNVNGQPFDPGRIDAFPRLGSTEIWRFRNTSMLSHPMHIHLNMFQILDRNGSPPAPGEAGWKDTVVVAPMETVRVITRFDDYLGVSMFHCHILEHEDRGLMGQFQVVPGAARVIAQPTSRGHQPPDRRGSGGRMMGGAP